MAPSLLEIAIRAVPRTRLWMFSSVTPGSVPANTLASALPKPSTGSAMGTMS